MPVCSHVCGIEGMPHKEMKRSEQCIPSLCSRKIIDFPTACIKKHDFLTRLRYAIGKLSTFLQHNKALRAACTLT